jgi:2-amino-4-hydroxy-6-hydroxymethyldihydropteridine diphosphokinase
LRQVCAEVASLDDCQLLARSRWVATVPIGGAEGQGEFLNGALLLETQLEPERLVEALQQIEQRLGRQRQVRWDARTVDIDLLLYGDLVLESSTLTLPHPRMAFRGFVLEPAAEIAGQLIHPTSGWTIARLFAHLQTSPRYVVVTASEAAHAECLLACLVEGFGCSVAEGVGLLAEGDASLPANRPGTLPVVCCVPAEALGSLAEAWKQQLVRPALVIAHAASSQAEEAELGRKHGLQPPGLGPVARITTPDRATMIQEAQAAVRCVWPDLT